jgi:hypothetical protein
VLIAAVVAVVVVAVASEVLIVTVVVVVVVVVVVRLELLGKWKQFIQFIGSRSHDLPEPLRYRSPDLPLEHQMLMTPIQILELIDHRGLNCLARSYFTQRLVSKNPF